MQQEKLEKFKFRINKLIDPKNMQGEQIYNCDEMRIFYRMLPNKTLAFGEESTASVYKTSKK